MTLTATQTDEDASHVFIFLNSWRELLDLAGLEISTFVFAIAIVVLARRGLRLNPSV
jgi:hypothetical protein